MGEFIFKLPDIGEGVVEAEITAWHVSVGDMVEEDAPLADAMTDKATIELTSPVEGVVKSLGCEEGDQFAVGGHLVVLETEGEAEAEPEQGSSNAPEDAVNPPSEHSSSAAGSDQFVFKLPDIGEGVVEAEITAWHVAVGDVVKEDAPLADAMTDKATIELTSPVSGKILALGCDEGDVFSVGGNLVTLEIEGAAPAPETKSLNETKSTQKKTDSASHSAPVHKTSSTVSSSSSAHSSSSKVLASPAVRKRAKESGLDLSKAKASGAEGQVTHTDLDLLEKAVEPAEGETRIKVIGLRRLIAQRMQEAKRNIPHFTYVEEIDVTELEAFRKRINEKKSDDKPKLTVLPLIIRAMAVLLRDWPQFNARYMDEQGYVSQFSDFNLGIATQTDIGLVVPVLLKAQTLSVWDMARELSRLAEGARTNKLKPEEMSGATTTLTSLGPLGGIVTTPVINRPEVAIFGPNKIRPKLVMENGEIVERKVMNFSVSCDHRVIDGYDAAKMMQDMKALLQDPQMMFLA